MKSSLILGNCCVVLYEMRFSLNSLYINHLASACTKNPPQPKSYNSKTSGSLSQEVWSHPHWSLDRFTVFCQILCKTLKQQTRLHSNLQSRWFRLKISSPPEFHHTVCEGDHKTFTIHLLISLAMCNNLQIVLKKKDGRWKRKGRGFETPNWRNSGSKEELKFA